MGLVDHIQDMRVLRGVKLGRRPKHQTNDLYRSVPTNGSTFQLLLQDFDTTNKDERMRRVGRRVLRNGLQFDFLHTILPHCEKRRNAVLTIIQK